MQPRVMGIRVGVCEQTGQLSAGPVGDEGGSAGELEGADDNGDECQQAQASDQRAGQVAVLSQLINVVELEKPSQPVEPSRMAVRVVCPGLDVSMARLVSDLQLTEVPLPLPRRQVDDLTDVLLADLVEARWRRHGVGDIGRPDEPLTPSPSHMATADQRPRPSV